MDSQTARFCFANCFNPAWAIIPFGNTGIFSVRTRLGIGVRDWELKPIVLVMPEILPVYIFKNGLEQLLLRNGAMPLLAFLILHTDIRIHL